MKIHQIIILNNLTRVSTLLNPRLCVIGLKKWTFVQRHHTELIAPLGHRGKAVKADERIRVKSPRSPL